jgi:hypothetical protein
MWARDDHGGSRLAGATKTGDRLDNGADDNASGVAAPPLIAEELDTRSRLRDDLGGVVEPIAKAR